MRPLILLLALAGCVQADQPVVLEPVESYDTPDGKPPALGTATLVEDGVTKTLTTFDFSIGAFDASAWFGEGLQERGFYLDAYPDGNSAAESGVLRLYGHYPSWTPGKAPGAAEGGLVEVSMGPDWRGRRWSSAGKPVEVVVDSFVPQEKGQTSGYGHVTGHFAATVCSGDKDPVVVAPGARCHEVSGSFATDMQYSP